MPLSDTAVSPSDASGSSSKRLASDLIDEIQERYRGIPFLALGQTVFWDEPTKAVWRRILDTKAPESVMITGVHDTDYFAKLSTQLHTEEKYAIVPHDDGATRDLWSAAGELSALFGSESIPTRQMFLDRGVPFDWLTKHGPGDKASRYAALTSAWGWRGLVRTDQQNVVAGDIPAVEIANAIMRLLDWGFTESLSCINEAGSREHAAALVNRVRSWITEFLEDCSDSCKLTELYETLLPRFYEMLLGHRPANVETTASTELFRFNTDTASSPKFRLLNAFLNPSTRLIACRSYNLAVRRSGIYELDEFGIGAIPFDLVVPQKGRGTIFLRTGRILAQLGGNEPVEVVRGTITNVEELAAAVEAKFGRKCALVGKAVVLPDMIGAEHLVLFHETASGYTGLTRKFNEGLLKAGITLDLYPVVRVTYPTWDALASIPASTTFTLPDHLSTALGSRQVSAPDFAAGWRDAVRNQSKILGDSHSLNKLRDLLTYLDAHDPKRQAVADFERMIGGPLIAPGELAPQPPIMGESEATPNPTLKGGESENDSGSSNRSPCWCDLLLDYERALAFLRDNAEKSMTLKSRIEEHHEEHRIWIKQRIELERRMGDDWRANVLPLAQALSTAEGQTGADIDAKIQRQMALRSTAFEEPIAVLKERMTSTKILIASFRKERRRLERSPEALAARAVVARIAREAQAARLMLVRNAYLAVDGLTHTHLRPTSWWFPLVDSTGAWFDAMVEGTRAEFEFLWPEPSNAS